MTFQFSSESHPGVRTTVFQICIWKKCQFEKVKDFFESESKNRDLIAEDDDERTFVLDLSSVLSR